MGMELLLYYIFMNRCCIDSVVLKWMMAISGVFLVGFVVIHMMGNLQIFLGRDAINDYAVLLKSNPAVLWGFRLGLLAMAAVHVGAAMALIRRNREAAGVDRYAVRRSLGASLASRSMALSGLMLLAFIVYHLLHFTVMAFHPEYNVLDEAGRHDVYGMMVAGFQVPWISAFYIVSVGLLALHLSHGVGSILRTLGAASVRVFWIGSIVGHGLALILFLGFASVPLSVLLGWVK
jgi:succinate dehydrogenase / fumarate reductase cytochrome b subunit